MKMPILMSLGTDDRQDMESLISQAFAHVDELAEHVDKGHYDLVGPEGEIIMPEFWDTAVEPGISIKMMLWEIRKEESMIEEIPPPGDDGILNLDDILNPGGSGEYKRRGGRERCFKCGHRKGNGSNSSTASSSSSKRSKGPGAFATWMLGAPARKPNC
jgi:hypothetical protein